MRYPFAFLAVSILLKITYSCAAIASDVTHITRKPAKLIEYSMGGHDTPEYVAKNIGLIESRPFDGIVLNDFVGRNLMSNDDTLRHGQKVWSYNQIMSNFAPIRPAIFNRFAYNFGKINMGMDDNPPDMFDDAGWQAIYKSAENYGRALKDAGLVGAFLDNEIYSYRYWLYPQHVQRKERSLLEYTQKAHERGQKFMQSLMKGFPRITVIYLHSPSECSAKTPNGVNDSDGINNCYYGAFGAGMLDASQNPRQFVDGGEAYHLRTAKEFFVSYNWRKTGIVKARVGFIPKRLRARWSRMIGISFGVYDDRFPKNVGPEMNAAITRKTLFHALCRADDFVWHYSEKRDWWVSPKDAGVIPAVTDEWLAAVADARKDAENCPDK